MGFGCGACPYYSICTNEADVARSQPGALRHALPEVADVNRTETDIIKAALMWAGASAASNWTPESPSPSTTQSIAPSGEHRPTSFAIAVRGLRPLYEDPMTKYHLIAHLIDVGLLEEQAARLGNGLADQAASAQGTIMLEQVGARTSDTSCAAHLHAIEAVIERLSITQPGAVAPAPVTA